MPEIHLRVSSDLKFGIAINVQGEHITITERFRNDDTKSICFPRSKSEEIIKEIKACEDLYKRTKLNVERGG